MSKSDSEFLDRLEATPRYNPSYRTLDSDRLFALARRGAAVAPRPIDEAPKDREVIGVERPPFEDQNYFHMGQWNEEHQQFMADAGYDVDTGKKRWAFCGVSHYVDPMAFPLLPEIVIEDGEDE